MLAAAEGVFTIAPGATHRTAGQPHECARTPGVRRLALDRTKYFGDAKHVGILVFRPAIVD